VGLAMHLWLSMMQKKIFLSALASTLFVAVCHAQTPDPTALLSPAALPNGALPSDDTWQSKLDFHVHNTFGPEAVLGAAAFAGYLQAIDSPREWGQGGVGYGRRISSTMAYAGVRNALGFGLDTALHQDPRYYRSGRTGLWSRTKYVLHATVFTRTDEGGETLATSRFASAYSAAFISNQWRPDRVNTTGLSLRQGTTQLGFDVLGNLGSEFWPDVKKKLLRR